MASPGDSMIMMKHKRARLLAMQKSVAEQKKKDEAVMQKEAATINLAECDLGASPQMRPVSLKGAKKFSPLAVARDLQYPNK